MKLALAAVLLAFAGLHDAYAISACGGESGWAADGAEVAPHPRIVYWTNGRQSSSAGTLLAKIDGKAVKTMVTSLDSAPNHLAVIEVDSDATGALTLEWKGAGLPAGRYTIKRTTYPKVAHATTSRYHSKLPHSTVREVFDGLAIKVDVPAMRAHVKLRRDAKSDWLELDVPVADHQLRIGELGCASNYQPQLLENGVDIDVALILPDGTSIPVDKLTHVAIPKLAKPTGSNPWDPE
ncbi:MAG TPA: hypothetical protein VFQ65_10585 [Kofleriaceae bacterium]|nr:hypothetical protein [Kofleriaceae bacterium]